MGIAASITASEFRIARSQEKAALSAFKEWNTELDPPSKKVAGARTLDQAFEAMSFEVTRDAHGEIKSLSYDEEGIGPLFDAFDDLWEALAPMVESGSFLTFSCDESEPWTWFFKGKNVHRRDHEADEGVAEQDVPDELDFG